MRITFLQKFHPKAKLRAWSQARTFGGTSKPKSLYICGFRRRNFFIFCACMALLGALIAVGAGVALSRSLEKGRDYKKQLDQAPIVTTLVSTEVVLSTGDGGVVITTFTTRSYTQTRPRNQPTPSVSTAPDGRLTTVSPSLTQTGTGTTTSGSASTSTSGGTATSTSASSTTSASAPPPDGDFFEGEGTFFTPGLGSCGIENSEADFVCALAKDLFDPDTPNGNANNNPNCGRLIYVQLAGGGERRKRDADNGSEYYTMVVIRGRVVETHRKAPRDDKLGRKGLEMPAQPTITPPPDPNARSKNLEKRNGATITVVDRCPVCAKYDLDMSPAAFAAIGADEADGRVEIEWKWVD